jgi:transglutaminase-like putative cysteine protease
MAVESRFGAYPDALSRYVRPTRLADFDDSSLRKAANDAVKDCKTPLQAFKALHAVVASLPLGFDRDDLRASEVLRAGQGHCNTKATLFVALCRAVRIPCRVRAWRVKKSVHKDGFPWLVYALTPKTTLFVFPEVFYKEQWVLLTDVLKTRLTPSWSADPFDDAPARKHPLQKEWIAQDLGSFWHPDVFYDKHGTNVAGWRKAAFPLAKRLLNSRAQ